MLRANSSSRQAENQFQTLGGLSSIDKETYLDAKNCQ